MTLFLHASVFAKNTCASPPLCAVLVSLEIHLYLPSPRYFDRDHCREHARNYRLLRQNQVEFGESNDQRLRADPEAIRHLFDSSVIKYVDGIRGH
jgi:hypothetical protein